MDANMQLTINSFRQLFPENSLTFNKIPDISLTAVKFPDISRFSRQVVTLIRGDSLANFTSLYTLTSTVGPATDFSQSKRYKSCDHIKLATAVINCQ